MDNRIISWILGMANMEQDGEHLPLTLALVVIERRFELNTVSHRHQGEHLPHLSLEFVTAEQRGRPDDNLKSRCRSRKPSNNLSISSQFSWYRDYDSGVSPNGGPPSSRTNSERAEDTMVGSLLQKDVVAGPNKLQIAYRVRWIGVSCFPGIGAVPARGVLNRGAQY